MNSEAKIRKACSLLALTALSSGLISGCASVESQNLTKNSACVANELSEVFDEPLKFEGMEFCGYVYYFTGRGWYGFYPEPIINLQNFSYSKPVMIPTKNLADQPLLNVQNGQRFFIQGTLRPDRECIIGELDCTPWKTPIYIDVSSIEAR